MNTLIVNFDTENLPSKQLLYGAVEEALREIGCTNVSLGPVCNVEGKTVLDNFYVSEHNFIRNVKVQAQVVGISESAIEELLSDEEKVTQFWASWEEVASLSENVTAEEFREFLAAQF